MVIKFKEFIFLGTLVVCVACGTQKKIINKSPRKTVRQQAKPKEIKIQKEAPVVVKEEIPKVVVPRIQEPVVERTYVPSNDPTQDYINKFSSIAVAEMNKYKIPASITLAQGVLESGSGKSELALKSNNHFGIKCHKGWKGSSVRHDDDALAECFRKYEHPETSYEDHSKFLTSRSRYGDLFKLQLTDYVGWAYGLKKAGYATDSRYPNKLIAIINKYNLQVYDSSEGFVGVQEEVLTPSPSQVRKVHNVKKGDTLYSISRAYNISVEELKRLNGLNGNTISLDQELLIN